MTKILCVDDEPMNLRMYSRILNVLGEVVTADDGQESLDIFTKSPLDYDLIVTDNDMPRLSGLQFLAKIIGYEKPPRLMISGTENPILLHAAVRTVKGLGLYEKPFKNDELKTIAGELLQYGRSPALDEYFRKKGFPF